jgi:hypothetical protein
MSNLSDKLKSKLAFDEAQYGPHVFRSGRKFEYARTEKLTALMPVCVELLEEVMDEFGLIGPLGTSIDAVLAKLSSLLEGRDA